MKIYIHADMEGISGIGGSVFVKQDGHRYNQGCKYFADDANACIQACVEAGADEIIFVDTHGGGCNVDWAELHPAAELVRPGGNGKRFADIEGSDAMILLGYHAMAGTKEAFLEHTYSSSYMQNIWLNGNKIGEFGVDAAIAGEYNVPVVMVSGDDKICMEAQALIPDIVTCQVKKAYSTEGARLMPRKKAHELIKEKTREALGKIKQIKPYKIDVPFAWRVEHVERFGTRMDAGVTVIDARTSEIMASSVEQAFVTMH